MPNYFSSDFYVLCHYDKRDLLHLSSVKGHQGNVCLGAPPTKLRHCVVRKEGQTFSRILISNWHRRRVSYKYSINLW